MEPERYQKCWKRGCSRQTSHRAKTHSNYDDPASYDYCLDHAVEVLQASGHVSVTPLSEIGAKVPVVCMFCGTDHEGRMCPLTDNRAEGVP